MHNYQTLKWEPNFSVFARPFARGFTLSDHEKLLIENIWRNETIKRPNLFNGQIFNVVEISSNKIEGEFVDYRYFLAGKINSELKKLLNIRPLSVSGLTAAGDKILFGLRTSYVTEFPDYYELVPSGGIDLRTQDQEGGIDIIKQLQLELWEETKISVTDLKGIVLNGLACDLDEDSFEIYATLNVSYTILKEYLEPSDEYQKLLWISKEELRAFLKKHQEKIVPFSLFLLHQAKLFSI